MRPSPVSTPHQPLTKTCPRCQPSSCSHSHETTTWSVGGHLPISTVQWRHNPILLITRHQTLMHNEQITGDNHTIAAMGIRNISVYLKGLSVPVILNVTSGGTDMPSSSQEWTVVWIREYHGRDQPARLSPS